jgi:uncharacterized BrkB/YihY/UPF0761 family membrane protein
MRGLLCLLRFLFSFPAHPLVCVALATLFVQDREVTARQILTQVDQYLPLQESDRVLLLHTMHGVIEHGLGAGLLGLLVLTWSSLRFSQALVIGVSSLGTEKL